MRRGGISIVMSAVMLLVLGACDKTIHEYPNDAEVPVKVILDLQYDMELPFHKEIIYTKSGAEEAESKSDTKASDAAPRYIINIYKSEDGEDFGREVYQQVTIDGYPETSEEGASVLDRKVEIGIVPGLYKFMVWTDYGQHYDASDFAEVKIEDSYEGSTDLRDAFRGVTESEIYAVEDASKYVAGTVGDQVVTVESERPMAKISFITTDLDEFITKVLSLREKELSEANAGENEGEPDSKAGTDTKSVDLSDFSVKFRYTGFCPISFNMFSNKPADAVTGMSFDGFISQLSEAEAEIGFDYVFVNGSESSIPVMVEVYNSSGTLMASSNPIDVPVVRSHLTVVRGEFLSSIASGAVGIDPGYDGEYNVRIY